MTHEGAEEVGRVLRGLTDDEFETALDLIEKLLEARSQAATKKATQTAAIMRHAALQQLAVCDEYLGRSPEVRRAECALTGQQA